MLAPSSAAADPVRPGDGPVQASVVHRPPLPPRIRWGKCPKSWNLPRGWRCALYPVPRDYAHPGAGSLRLAVAMLPATSRRGRRGSVFFNPGGRGGGGLAAASYWERYVGPSVRRAYDLVTWDPRGVVHSVPPLLCLSPSATITAATTPDAVLTDREMARRLKGTAPIGHGCATKRLARFVTTMDNVRDLDRLRQAVRDRRLTYVGISYGTVIGALYANVFPTRYRALSLHGVVDSVTWFRPTFAFTTDDAVQLQKTLRAALAACDDAPAKCAFAPGAAGKYAKLLAAVRADALARRDSENFTGLVAASQSLVSGSPPVAEQAAALLEQAYQEFVVHHAAASQELQSEAEAPQEPLTWGPVAEAASSNVRDATICSDAGRMPSAWRTWIAAARHADARATTFGVQSVLDRSACAAWHAFGATYRGGWAHGAAPILVLNQVWDHATPLAWARTMTRRLGRAHLLTISGWGHGVQTPCGRRAVDHYLLTGRPSATSYCSDGHPLF